MGLIPGLGRSPGGGNGNPLQYSCLGNPKDRGAWKAIVQELDTCRDSYHKSTNDLQIVKISELAILWEIFRMGSVA